MRTLARTVTTATSVGGIALLLLGSAFQVAGARINTSKSVPVGLYWTTRTPMEKGAYVLFCPPPSGVFNEARERGYIGAGFCPGGYGYLMKQVAATARDTVTVTSEGSASTGNDGRTACPVSLTRRGGGCHASRPTATSSAMRKSC